MPGLPRLVMESRLVERDILDLSSQLRSLLFYNGRSETILKRDTVTPV
jgi:hypothetical protein